MAHRFKIAGRTVELTDIEPGQVKRFQLLVDGVTTEHYIMLQKEHAEQVYFEVKSTLHALQRAIG